MSFTDSPKTLQQAIVHFADPDNCVAYMVERRWPDGVVKCPTCGSDKVTFIAKRRVWQCKTRHAKCQFSVKVGTIMEDSPIPLDKWLMSMWMVANCRNGVSSHEIARSIAVTQKSAWFMLHRIRLAMKARDMGTKLGSNDGGEVEVDEAFVGGKPRNMHQSRRLALGQADHKTAVIGIIDRETREVRAKVVPNVKRETLQKEILKNVKYGSSVYTDQAVAYDTLKHKYIHDTVNHAETYVNGRVHTNSLENFWSLMKRNLAGTYVAVEPFHLDRYIDEQAFRFNNRIGVSDAQRLAKVADQLLGLRLTYAELTGKNATAAGKF
ncbi:MAG: IS1595 family transposase [Acidobacteria bacterium]|nr:IS1595 family transposase [Acidobacteriota bacterium]